MPTKAQLQEEIKELKLQIVKIKKDNEDFIDWDEEDLLHKIFMLKFDNKHLVFDNKQLVYNNTELKRKIYVFDSEIGVLTDKTILKSYQTQKFKKWRRDNLQNRIVYECIDDDSDLHLGNYIKMLEDIN